MKNNKSLGNLGEDVAQKYLTKKGYKIIERNFQTKWGEIDLICRERDTIVFVEVKTRVGERFGLPEDAFNRDKLTRLKRNAVAYMSFRAKNFNKYRIDAVCIVLDELKIVKKINYYENIVS